MVDSGGELLFSGSINIIYGQKTLRRHPHHLRRQHATYTHRSIHYVFSMFRKESKDFLYKSSQIMGFPDIFAMWHFFIENRIFRQKKNERLARKMIEESVFHGKWITFVRWIFPILKKYFVSSIIPTATVQLLTRNPSFFAKSIKIPVWGGFSLFFAMWHFFIENRIFRQKKNREVRMQTTIGERFSRAMNNFCKMNFAHSQKKWYFKKK